MISYREGLAQVSGNVLAYLQPDGGWGYSNAGAIVSAGQALVVDTLLDLHGAWKFRTQLAERTNGAFVSTVVNTHSHRDHTAGNAVFSGAEFIASAATAREMRNMAAGNDPIGDMLTRWRDYGEAGLFLHEVMGSRFDIPAGQLLPTREFGTRVELRVGEVDVVLLNVGPAHTAGDTVVHVPHEGVLFTGDVVFRHVHPMAGAVPVAELRSACERLRQLRPLIVVPGHGPVTDGRGLQDFIDYLDYVQTEARRRFDAGMPWAEAARDIPLAGCEGWADAERIVLTTAGLYRDWGAALPPMADVFAATRRYRRDRCGAGDAAAPRR